MDPTSSIRKLGFRKWYERQLIDCHLALVTCLLCGITIAALIEDTNVAEMGWLALPRLGILVAAVAIGWLAWRRYITVLGRAELYGERSNCPSCDTYGRFNVLATGLDEIPSRAAAAVAPLDTAWMRVECRKCGATWRMPE